MTPREEILQEAQRLVCGDRNEVYGTPYSNFSSTARIWNEIFAPLLKDDREFEAYHVAMALIAVKMSRLTHTPGHKDSWTDVCGYAATGYEAWVEGHPPVQAPEGQCAVAYSRPTKGVFLGSTPASPGTA